MLRLLLLLGDVDVVDVLMLMMGWVWGRWDDGEREEAGGSHIHKWYRISVLK
jgi:hypothetical protein